MSSFSSAILSGSVLDTSRLQSVLDSYLPARWTTASSLSLTSTSSSSAVDMDAFAVSVSGVTADELLIYLCQHTVSVGTANAVAATITFRGATNLENYLYSQPSTADTNGLSASQSPAYIDQNQSGAVTYYQKFYRNGGSGTIYSLGRIYHAIQLKKRT